MMLLLGSILNTLLPAGAMVGVVYVVLRWRGWNAATRYAIWWLTLAGVLLAPALYDRRPLRAVAGAEAVAGGTASGVEPAAPRERLVRAEEGGPVRRIRVANERTLRRLAVVWALGALLLLLRLGRSYLHLRWLKRQGQVLDVPHGVLPERVRCRVLRELRSPLAAGFWRPAILVPEAVVATLDARQLETVLWHEYAHLKRADPWWNLLGRLVEAVFWWHPLVWVIGRQIQREREMACDDFVVARTADPAGYATTLLRLAELRLLVRMPVLATGFLGPKTHLVSRVEELVAAGRRFVPRLQWGRFVAAALPVLVLCYAVTRAAVVVAFAAPASEPSRGGGVVTASRKPESFLASLRAAGYGDLPVEDIVRLKTNGLPGEWIREVAALLGRPSVEELIALHQHGVRGRHIERAQKLNPQISVSMILRLKDAGVLEEERK